MGVRADSSARLPRHARAEHGKAQKRCTGERFSRADPDTKLCPTPRRALSWRSVEVAYRRKVGAVGGEIGRRRHLGERCHCRTSVGDRAFVSELRCSLSTSVARRRSRHPTWPAREGSGGREALRQTCVIAVLSEFARRLHLDSCVLAARRPRPRRARTARRAAALSPAPPRRASSVAASSRLCSPTHRTVRPDARAARLRGGLAEYSLRAAAERASRASEELGGGRPPSQRASHSQPRLSRPPFSASNATVASRARALLHRLVHGEVAVVAANPPPGGDRGVRRSSRKLPVGAARSPMTHRRRAPAAPSIVHAIHGFERGVARAAPRRSRRPCRAASAKRRGSPFDLREDGVVSIVPPPASRALARECVARAVTDRRHIYRRVRHARRILARDRSFKARKPAASISRLLPLGVARRS